MGASFSKRIRSEEAFAEDEEARPTKRQKLERQHAASPMMDSLNNDCLLVIMSHLSAEDLIFLLQSATNVSRKCETMRRWIKHEQEQSFAPDRHHGVLCSTRLFKTTGMPSSWGIARNSRLLVLRNYRSLLFRQKRKSKELNSVEWPFLICPFIVVLVPGQKFLHL